MTSNLSEAEQALFNRPWPEIPALFTPQQETIQAKLRANQAEYDRLVQQKQAEIAALTAEYGRRHAQIERGIF
jgi:hypothetical protein